jgi:isopentenyl-diphosphate delta-isomerase
MTAREQDLVELVSADGMPIGSATVATAHSTPGQLHRAFSVLLFDEQGRTLLQRRAKVKSRFPLRWGNACCGHPAPGEDVVAAGSRRLRDELGIDGVALAEVGVYAYLAVDPATGRVEREYDHVLVGRVPHDVVIGPDPAEVGGTRWESIDDLLRVAELGEYVPWLMGVLNVAIHAKIS